MEGLSATIQAVETNAITKEALAEVCHSQSERHAAERRDDMRNIFAAIERLETGRPTRKAASGGTTPDASKRGASPAEQMHCKVSKHGA